MASTPATRTRFDATASIFAYGIVGVVLLVHAVTTITRDWSSDDLVLHASNDSGARSVVVAVDAVPGWASTALRAADVVGWLAAASVLVALTACVLGMVRGEVFSRSTARWATTSSWGALALLVLPLVPGLPATNMALQSAPGDWDALVLDERWWTLYVGMMTLSFLALVLRRGSQLQADQDGLI